MTVIDHAQLNKMEIIQNKLHEKLPDLRQRYGIK